MRRRRHSPKIAGIALLTAASGGRELKLNGSGTPCIRQSPNGMARLLLSTVHMLLAHTDDQSELDIQAEMRRDHERLERLFDELLAAFQTDAGPACEVLWTKLDRGVREHFTLEEKYMLPRFAEVYPAEAAALLREHATILSRLESLGVGVDLHLTRANVVEELVRALRAHAPTEDQLMYRWSQTTAAEAGNERWKAHIQSALFGRASDSRSHSH